MTEYFPQPDVEEEMASKRMRDDDDAQYGRRKVCSLNELLEVCV